MTRFSEKLPKKRRLVANTGIIYEAFIIKFSKKKKEN